MSGWREGSGIINMISMAPFAALLCFVFLFFYLGSSGGDFAMEYGLIWVMSCYSSISLWGV